MRRTEDDTEWTGNARRDERDDDDDGRGGVSWDDRATDEDRDRECGGKERKDPDDDVSWVSYRADARDGVRNA